MGEAIPSRDALIGRLSFFYLGVALMLPWNAVITTMREMAMYGIDPSHGNWYTVTTYYSVASLFILVLMFSFGDLVSIKMRVYSSFSILSLLLVILTLITYFKARTSFLFHAGCVCVVLIGLAGGIAQGSVLGFASSLSDSRNTAYTLMGLAYSSLVMIGIQAFTKVFRQYPEGLDASSAEMIYFFQNTFLIYFVISIIVVIGSVGVSYWVFSIPHISKHYIYLHKKLNLLPRSRSENNRNNESSTESSFESNNSHSSDYSVYSESSVTITKDQNAKTTGDLFTTTSHNLKNNSNSNDNNTNEESLLGDGVISSLPLSSSPNNSLRDSTYFINSKKESRKVNKTLTKMLNNISSPLIPTMRTPPIFDLKQSPSPAAHRPSSVFLSVATSLPSETLSSVMLKPAKKTHSHVVNQETLKTNPAEEDANIETSAAESLITHKKTHLLESSPKFSSIMNSNGDVLSIDNNHNTSTININKLDRPSDMSSRKIAFELDDDSTLKAALLEEGTGCDVQTSIRTLRTLSGAEATSSSSPIYQLTVHRPLIATAIDVMMPSISICVMSICVYSVFPQVTSQFRPSGFIIPQVDTSAWMALAMQFAFVMGDITGRMTVSWGLQTSKKRYTFIISTTLCIFFSGFILYIFKADDGILFSSVFKFFVTYGYGVVLGWSCSMCFLEATKILLKDYAHELSRSAFLLSFSFVLGIFIGSMFSTYIFIPMLM